MLLPYKLTLSKNKLSYQFTSGAGNAYNVYFTRFYLQLEDEEIEIFSFGFNQTETNREVSITHDPRIGFNRIETYREPSDSRDARIRTTIQQIILDFFVRNNNKGAIVYICDQTDGKTGPRSRTFTRWFEALSESFIKCDSHAEYEKDDFFSSIIISNANPDKGKLIDAFYYTLEYWMG